MTHHALFAVPVEKGRIIPSEYDEAHTETCLNKMFLDKTLGEFEGETGLSTGPQVLNLHEFEELQWLFRPLTLAVRDYWVNVLGYRKMMYVDPHDAWANKHFAGDSTVTHNHRDGWWGQCQVSGVFYFRKPRGSSNIHFINPNDYLLRMTPYACMIGTNDHSVECQADDFEYLLFPSWLKHRVPPSKVQGPRICISFNYYGHD